MSISQNSTSPRARMQEARQREQRAEAVRRRVVTGVSAGLVVALAAGVAIAIGSAGGSSGSNRSTAKPAAAPAAASTLVTPAHTSGQDGTVIVYGKPDAPHTLAVYEDFRCPICKRFEAADGQAVQQLADDGTYRIEYHLAAFLDDNLGGKGSITALAAAGAALNQSVDDFKKFHDVLYANQPAEQQDGFGDVNRILDLAGQVPGLKTDAFVAAVKDGTYLPWASKVAAAFNSSGVTGTPTMQLDGQQLTIFDTKGPITPDQFTSLVKAKVGTR